MEKSELERLNGELESLRQENKRLARQVEFFNRIVEQNKITQRAKANVSRIISKERSNLEMYMNLLLANSPEIIILFDNEGRFAYCAEALIQRARLRNFGLIEGKTFREVFSSFANEEWLDRVEERFNSSISQRKPVVFAETIDIGGDGNPRTYTVHYAPVLNENGVIECSIAIFHDMTDIIEAKEAALKASGAKGDFLANMSHEMRTPLNAIMGMTGIAMSTTDTTRKDYCLTKINEASTHLSGVINDILDMSKIEANKFELSENSFCLEKTLIKAVGVLTFKIDGKNQNFFTDIDTDLPRYISSDEQRLTQVISNLLSNAVKFTPDHGSISMSVKKLSESNGSCVILFQIKDSGIGISAEQQKNLFRSFEQADGSISRRFGGTGLGLAISKNIVEKMGGDIRVESAIGKGSTFSFTITARIGYDHKNKIREDVSWNTLKILAVDDAEDVREYFKALAGVMRFDVTVAENGQDAFNLIEDGAEFDIIFVDYKMPYMSGVEFTSRLKRYNLQTSPVVIMISSADWSEIEGEALSAGVDHYLQKPLFPSLITDCVNRCLGKNEIKLAETAGARSDGDLKGKRILLAEDIEINREIVAALLEDTGAVIDFAVNGRDVLERFAADCERNAADGYDMIFMDIHMPEMDGYEATRRIRALKFERAKNIPIVAMTANVFREDVERCLAAGMNAHVGKPLDFGEVLKVIGRFIKNP